jgi:GNAT superfamily N-acetyltransferase
MIVDAILTSVNQIGTFMEIRPAQHSDIAQLNVLYEERRILLAQSDSRMTVVPVDWSQRFSQGWVMVAGEENGRIIGYIAGYMINEDQTEDRAPATPPTGVIEELALDAHKYHGGLGRQLYQRLRRTFDENGCSPILVRVPRFHAVEQAFWRSLGAQPHTDHLRKSTASEVWMRL